MSAAPQWNPASATPYNPYASQNWGTSDPRKIASNLTGTNATAYGNADQYAKAVQDYLGNIISPMAQGQGGYLPSEISQIEMSPEEKRNLVASSAIAAGTPTMAAADAAQRAANAAGGNPAAVAAYRSRAAQQAGAQAGNAATNAQVGAQQALAGETANVGQARLGQQGQALGYLAGLQGQENQNAQNAANRMVQGSQIGLQASQTPSTFDKVMGGIGGALTAFLDEGAVPTYRAVGASLPGTPPQGIPPAQNYLDEGRTAIVAEKDPEAVVRMDDAGDLPVASSMPGVLWEFPESSLDMNQPNPGTGGAVGMSSSPMKGSSFWQGIRGKASGVTPSYRAGAGTGSANLGSAIGSMARYLDDGDMPQGDYCDDGAIFTKPTKLSLEPNEAVVPLSYRSKAKARPSMALPLVDKIQRRGMYQGLARGKV